MDGLGALGLGSLRFSNEIPVGSSPPSSKRLGLRRLPRRELGAGLFLRLPEVPRMKILDSLLTHECDILKQITYVSLDFFILGT